MTTQNLPLVTVYIPTYNRVELLKRAVKSVQEQTYQNLEIIIVDDCSTDETHKYLENLAKEDSRVRYFLKETNSGACVSRNIAIENAQGEFITGLDDDDYFLAKRIEIFINAYRRKKKTTVALFTPTFSFKEKNGIKAHILFMISKKNIINKDLYFANHIGNQIFAKKEIYIEAGLFDPEFAAWQDFDLWFRISKIGNLERLKDATYYFDKSENRQRITNSKIEKILKVRDQFIFKHNIDNKILRLGVNNHLFNYDPKMVKLSNLIVRLVFQFNDPKNSINYFFRFVLSRFKD